MSEVEEEFSERLKDDLAGIRDALDVGDWAGVLKIAEGLRDQCPGEGWPLVGRLAGDLCSLLTPDAGENVPTAAIEVLVDAAALAISANVREEDNMDEGLRAGLDQLRKRLGL